MSQNIEDYSDEDQRLIRELEEAIQGLAKIIAVQTGSEVVFLGVQKKGVGHICGVSEDGVDLTRMKDKIRELIDQPTESVH